MDYIAEIDASDHICEQNGDWCEEHCKDTLRRECVMHFLENHYDKT